MRLEEVDTFLLVADNIFVADVVKKQKHPQSERSARLMINI